MKTFFQFAIAFFSMVSFAQTKFVEVEVRDTISLKPESVEYIIKVQGHSMISVDEDEYSYDPKVEKEKYAKMMEELKKLLQAKKYNFRALENTNYELNSISYFYDSGYIVTIKNINELRELKKLLEDLDYVSGSIGSVDYENEGKAEELLLKKLVERSRSKANILAAASGMKLGKIIEIKEVKEVDNFMFNIADMYTKLGRSNSLGMEKGNMVGSLSKALVVKFAAE